MQIQILKDCLPYIDYHPLKQTVLDWIDVLENEQKLLTNNDKEGII